MESVRGFSASNWRRKKRNWRRTSFVSKKWGAARRKLARELEEKRHALFAILSAIAQFNNQYSSAAKRIEVMAEQFERDRREKNLLEEQLADTARLAGELEKGLDRLLADREETAAALAVLKGREEEVKGALAAKERKLQESRNELSGKSSRLHSLQELEARFDGYGRGIRTLLLADNFRGRFPGIVADAIETDEAYETAVEAVLGEKLQYVLSSGSNDVMAAIGFLKESSGGRCSFITGNIAVPLSPPPSGAVGLLTKVTIAPELRRFVEPLLSGAYLADDLTAAFRLAGDFPELTFVTPQGELVHSSGIVHGGSMEAAQKGFIHKKREIRDLSREVSALSELVRDLSAECASLREQTAVIEEELQDLRQKQHQADLDIAHTEKDLLRSREGWQRLEERLALKCMEDDQFREEKEILEREMADSVAKQNESEERKSVLEREVSELTEALTVKRRELGETREKVTAAKVNTAALKERSESGRRAEKRFENLLLDLHERIAGHETELAKGDSEGTGITDFHRPERRGPEIPHGCAGRGRGCLCRLQGALRIRRGGRSGSGGSSQVVARQLRRGQKTGHGAESEAFGVGHAAQAPGGVAPGKVPAGDGGHNSRIRRRILR